jgi:hypothetical protein
VYGSKYILYTSMLQYVHANIIYVLVYYSTRMCFIKNNMLIRWCNIKLFAYTVMSYLRTVMLVWKIE